MAIALDAVGGSGSELGDAFLAVLDVDDGGVVARGEGTGDVLLGGARSAAGRAVVTQHAPTDRGQQWGVR